MKVASDIDGVIANIYSTWRDVVNKKYKLNIRHKDCNNYSFVCGKNLKLEKKERRRLYKESKPYRGAVTFFKNLRKMDIPIYLITARADCGWEYEGIKEDTIHWLHKYGIPFDRLIFTMKKNKPCKQYSLDLMLEDSTNQANWLLQTKTEPILIDRPWNRETYSKNLIRVHSWKETMNVVKHYENIKGPEKY